MLKSEQATCIECIYKGKDVKYAVRVRAPTDDTYVNMGPLVKFYVIVHAYYNKRDLLTVNYAHAQTVCTRLFPSPEEPGYEANFRHALHGRESRRTKLNACNREHVIPAITYLSRVLYYAR